MSTFDSSYPDRFTTPHTDNEVVDSILVRLGYPRDSRCNLASLPALLCKHRGVPDARIVWNEVFGRLCEVNTGVLTVTEFAAWLNERLAPAVAAACAPKIEWTDKYVPPVKPQLPRLWLHGDLTEDPTKGPVFWCRCCQEFRHPRHFQQPHAGHWPPSHRQILQEQWVEFLKNPDQHANVRVYWQSPSNLCVNGGAA